MATSESLHVCAPKGDGDRNGVLSFYFPPLIPFYSSSFLNEVDVDNGFSNVLMCCDEMCGDVRVLAIRAGYTVQCTQDANVDLNC